jgi:ATP synthase protein I
MASQASPTPPEPDPSFAARLSAARRRQGLDPAPHESGAVPVSAMGIGLRVGVELVSALVVAVGIGWGLDRWLGTKPWLLALFVPIGGVAGVLNVWRLLGPQKKSTGTGDGPAKS